MVREKRSASPPPAGGTVSQFKRLRDRSSSRGTPPGHDYAVTHHPGYEIYWPGARSLAQDPWYDKCDRNNSDSQSDTPYLDAAYCSQAIRSVFPMAPSDPMAPALDSPRDISARMLLDPASQMDPLEPSRSAHGPRTSDEPSSPLTMTHQSAARDRRAFQWGSGPPRRPSQISHASGSVEIGNVPALRKYFWNRFSALLVNPCKPVAARLVEALCPGKKQEYPYENPSKPELFNGQPAWWPDSVEYRSPHHMRKKKLLEFLAYTLTLPLTNRQDLREIFREGPFSNWSQLLNSTLHELDLHDGKYPPGDPEKREFDEMRHQARSEVLKELYRVSILAAKCADGEIDRHYRTRYNAVPVVCFRERKRHCCSSSDDKAESCSTTSLEHHGSDLDRAESNEPFGTPARYIAGQDMQQYQSPSRLHPEVSEKLDKRELNELRKRVPTPQAQRYIEAARKGDAFERTRHQPQIDRVSSWQATFQEPSPTSTTLIGVQSENPSKLVKMEDFDATNPNQQIHDVNMEGTVGDAWSSRYETIDVHRGAMTQLSVTPYEPSYGTHMTKFEAGFYPARNMSTFTLSAPEQDTQYYSSHPCPHVHQGTLSGGDEQALVSYDKPLDQRYSLFDSPPVESSNFWSPPGRNESSGYKCGHE